MIPSCVLALLLTSSNAVSVGSPLQIDQIGSHGAMGDEHGAFAVRKDWASKPRLYIQRGLASPRPKPSKVLINRCLSIRLRQFYPPSKKEHHPN